LLQKTLLNIEGLGRQLYPDLDLWQTAKPFLEDWFKERMGPKAKIQKMVKQIPEIAEHFPEMPTLIFQALESATHTRRQIESQNQQISQLRSQMEKNHGGTIWAILGSAVLVSLAVLFQ
jgi:ubiquinone biosynthesis protein